MQHYDGGGIGRCERQPCVFEAGRDDVEEDGGGGGGHTVALCFNFHERGTQSHASRSVLPSALRGRARARGATRGLSRSQKSTTDRPLAWLPLSPALPRKGG